MTNNKIICVGAGVMASAFSVAQAEKNKVTIIPTPYDTNIVQAIESSGTDPRLEVKWPSAKISFKSVEETINDHMVEEADVIVVGVSSAGISWAVGVLQQLLSNKEGKSTLVVLLTKGVIPTDEEGKEGEDSQQQQQQQRQRPQKVQVLSEYIESKVRNAEVLAITGPCIAKVLAQHQASNIMLCGKKTEPMASCKSILSLPFLEISTTTDYIGAQWSAALKNVYAILIAKAGAGNMNIYSAKFANALEEMSVWVEDHGGSTKTVYGISGVGDLYVTCQGGRNGKFGGHLAEGLTIKEILEGPMKGVTVEGLELAQVLLPYASASKKPMFQELVDMLSASSL